MKVNVSDINGEVVLLGGVGIIPANLILEEALSNRFESGPGILWLLEVGSFELTDDLLLDSEITPFHNVRSGGLLLDGIVLGLEELNSELFGFHGFVEVFHPVD